MIRAFRPCTLALPALLAASVACAASRPGAAVAPVPARPPRTLVLRGEALVAARERVRAGDTALRPAYDRLLDDARKALAMPDVAVTQKPASLLAPSGDPHDYFSLSPYWWPDPSKADGLPYIRRDGETNPESKRELDQPRVARMGARAETLALAYFFTGDERWAEGAARQLRAWFLDPATRMNPHLRFSQTVRGNPKERGSGIIDSRWFIEAVDASRLLEGSKAWTPADEAALRAWFAQYLRWLVTSPNGIDESDAPNNHGSWYAAQVVDYALFTGDSATARRWLGTIPARIAAQIQPDGSQPKELERTRSYHYEGFNVEALSRLAELGRHAGVDLWGYRAPSGGSLRAAVDRLARYLPEPATWPGRQIDPIELDLFVMHLRRTPWAIPGADYGTTLARLPQQAVRADRSALLYPDRTAR